MRTVPMAETACGLGPRLHASSAGPRSSQTVSGACSCVSAAQGSGTRAVLFHLQFSVSGAYQATWPRGRFCVLACG